MNRFTRMWRFRERLTGLPLPNKLYYVANTLYGEIFRRRSIGTFGLRMVEIGLTDRCQCNCAHCYAATNTPLSVQEELTTGEVMALLDQVAAMRAAEVCFSGGEPLLRRDIVDLVEYARARYVLPKINTNGILLTESLVQELKKAGLAWCLVSIDSPHMSQHDAFRGYAGCYDKAVEGLKCLVRRGVPTSIVTVARKGIIHNGDLAKIVGLGHVTQVNAVRILFPVPLGRFAHAHNEILSLDERKEVRKLAQDDPLVTLGYWRKSSICTAGVTKLNIRTNGEVTPCVFLPVSFGNIRQQSLIEIWEAMGEFARSAKPTGQCPVNDPTFRRKYL